MPGHWHKWRLELVPHMRRHRKAMNRARLIEKLDQIARMVEHDIEPREENWGLDEALKLIHEKHGVRRIRSIIRRLKRCHLCRGIGRFEFDQPAFSAKSQKWHRALACSRCNGTGRAV